VDRSSYRQRAFNVITLCKTCLPVENVSTSQTDNAAGKKVSVTISWDNVNDGHHPVAATHKIYQVTTNSDGTKNYTLLGSVAGTKTSYTVSDIKTLEGNSNYYFVVSSEKVVSGSTLKSIYSNEAYAQFDKNSIRSVELTNSTVSGNKTINTYVKHGPVKLAFTPDEEVGGLACNLDLGRFGADVAYTLDGDHMGYYSYETFNAIEAQLSITGLNVHPGTAKGIMVNAIEIAAEFIGMLPKLERPQYTEGREGFYHPHGISGNVENAKLLCLIRDHDEGRFEERKEYIRKCVAELDRRYGDGRVELVFANGYSSMKKAVDKVPFMIDYLVEAIKDSGVEPTELAFRGGTDGSAISQRGLPCPNLSAGYENGHSRFEFVSVQTMSKNVEILLRLCEIYADGKK